MEVLFGDRALDFPGTLAVMIAEGPALGSSARELDGVAGGRLSRAIGVAKLTGKSGEMLDLLAPAGIAAERVVILGLGKAAELSRGKAIDLGGGLASHLLAVKCDRAAVVVDADLLEGCGLDAAGVAAELAFGMRLKTYRFGRYRTKQPPEEQPALAALTLMLDDHRAAAAAFAGRDGTARAIDLARDLVSEPANVLFPESMAERIAGLAETGLAIETLDLAKLREIGMGAILGVAQGSDREPRVVIMRWAGGVADAAPLAFIGKGVTFDSGGLSLKTAKGMEDMKWDMAGAAAVVGLMAALASRRAKVNAVGIVGLVENMPSGGAQRPGDVVVSLSGQTIEVLNTDAEGRLVLADLLTYAQNVLKPALMIDLATLTGAIITALGNEHAGLFCNNDALADRLLAAGRSSGEALWRLPLGDAYDRLLRSDIADMKNIGDATAGSIVGAQFLQRFVNDTPWAHLDIAGTAWSGKDKPTSPKGATGFGVRLLDDFVAEFYENAAAGV